MKKHNLIRLLEEASEDLGPVLDMGDEDLLEALVLAQHISEVLLEEHQNREAKR